MTAPSGSGAPTTLTPGAAAVLLTEYAPSGDDAGLTIINDSTTRAYLADDSSVSPSNGVPLDPHTSTSWSNGGQIWAVADPDATAPALLIATGAIGDWQPSPAVIGLEVAQQLLETGVPNVIVQTVLAAGEHVSTDALTFDVRAFASLAIAVVAGGVGDLSELGVGIALDVNGQYLLQELVCYEFTGVIDCGDAATLTIGCPGSMAASVTVIGSNRETGRRFDGRNSTATPVSVASATTHFQYSLSSANDVLVGNTITLQGQVFAHFFVIGAITGYFYVQVGNLEVPLLDTSELTTWSSGVKHLTRMIALPAATPSAIYFRPFNSSLVTGSVGCDLIPASI